MDEQYNLQRTLNEKLAQAKSKNPSYSLRSFAKKLGLSPGALSAILNGKRRISAKLAQRLIERLALTPQEQLKISKDFRSPNTKTFQRVESVQLDMDHYRVLADWYHFALLNLVPLEGFSADPSWMARRLGIRQSQARLAWERLTRLGLAVQDESGRWKRQALSYRTSDDVKNASLRLAHAQNLDLARRSLEEDDVQARDFNAVTFAFHPDKIPYAKQRIRAFMKELSEELEAGAQTEVFNLCVQLFPLSKPLEEK